LMPPKPLSSMGVLQALCFRWGPWPAGQRSGDAQPQPAWAIDGSCWPGATPIGPVVARRGLCAASAGGCDRKRKSAAGSISAHQALQSSAHRTGPRPAAAAPGRSVLPPPASAVCSAWRRAGLELAAESREANRLLSGTLCAGSCTLQLTAPVVAPVLEERLSADSGRFGHRSGP